LLVLEDRLDPALRQFAAARTDLSPSVLGVVRNSLNQRRCETARGVNTVGVEIENREARSIPVRIYRGGPAPAPAVIFIAMQAPSYSVISTPITRSVWSSRDAAAAP
jgi:acetyl esterase